MLGTDLSIFSLFWKNKLKSGSLDFLFDKMLKSGVRLEAEYGEADIPAPPISLAVQRDDVYPATAPIRRPTLQTRGKALL